MKFIRTAFKPALSSIIIAGIILASSGPESWAQINRVIETAPLNETAVLPLNLPAETMGLNDASAALILPPAALLNLKPLPASSSTKARPTWADQGPRLPPFHPWPPSPGNFPSSPSRFAAGSPSRRGLRVVAFQQLFEATLPRWKARSESPSTEVLGQQIRSRAIAVSAEDSWTTASRSFDRSAIPSGEMLAQVIQPYPVSFPPPWGKVGMGGTAKGRGSSGLRALLGGAVPQKTLLRRAPKPAWGQRLKTFPPALSPMAKIYLSLTTVSFLGWCVASRMTPTSFYELMETSLLSLGSIAAIGIYDHQEFRPLNRANVQVIRRLLNATVIGHPTDWQKTMFSLLKDGWKKRWDMLRNLEGLVVPGNADLAAVVALLAQSETKPENVKAALRVLGKMGNEGAEALQFLATLAPADYQGDIATAVKVAEEWAQNNASDPNALADALKNAPSDIKELPAKLALARAWLKDRTPVGIAQRRTFEALTVAAAALETALRDGQADDIAVAHSRFEALWRTAQAMTNGQGASGLNALPSLNSSSLPRLFKRPIFWAILAAVVLEALLFGACGLVYAWGGFDTFFQVIACTLLAALIVSRAGQAGVLTRSQITVGVLLFSEVMAFASFQMIPFQKSAIGLGLAGCFPILAIVLACAAFLPVMRRRLRALPEMAQFFLDLERKRMALDAQNEKWFRSLSGLAGERREALLEMLANPGAARPLLRAVDVLLKFPEPEAITPLVELLGRWDDIESSVSLMATAWSEYPAVTSEAERVKKEMLERREALAAMEKLAQAAQTTGQAPATESAVIIAGYRQKISKFNDPSLVGRRTKAALEEHLRAYESALARGDQAAAAVSQSRLDALLGNFGSGLNASPSAGPGTGFLRPLLAPLRSILQFILRPEVIIGAAVLAIQAGVYLIVKGTWPALRDSINLLLCVNLVAGILPILGIPRIFPPWLRHPWLRHVAASTSSLALSFMTAILILKTSGDPDWLWSVPPKLMYLLPTALLFSQGVATIHAWRRFRQNLAGPAPNQMDNAELESLAHHAALLGQAQNESEALLLEKAKTALSELGTDSLPLRMKRAALEGAMQGLESALEAGQSDAIAIASQRLRALLSEARSS